MSCCQVVTGFSLFHDISLDSLALRTHAACLCRERKIYSYPFIPEEWYLPVVSRKEQKCIPLSNCEPCCAVQKAKEGVCCLALGENFYHQGR